MPPKGEPAKTPNTRKTRKDGPADIDPSDYTALDTIKKRKTKRSRNSSVQDQPDAEEPQAHSSPSVIAPAQAQQSPFQTLQVQQPPAQNPQNAATQAGQVIQLTLQTSLNVATSQGQQTAQTAAIGNPYVNLPGVATALEAAQNAGQLPTIPQPHQNAPASQTRHNHAPAPSADTPTPSIEPAGTTQASDGNDPFNNSEEPVAPIPERDDSPESHHSWQSQHSQRSHHSHHDAATQTTPPPRHPSHESEHGASSSSRNNPSHGSRRDGHPIRVPTPGGSPDPDQDAGVDEPDHPQPKRSFWEIFTEQVDAGVRHLMSRQGLSASIAGFILLVFQLCSAGRLCYKGDTWCPWNAFKAITPFVGRYFMTYICLWGANTLAIFGLFDIWKADFGRLEPFLMLLATFGLQNLRVFSSPRWFGDVSVPVRLIWISGLVHLVKWFLEALEIHHNWVRQRSTQMRRPLVIGFLCVLVLGAVVVNKDIMNQDRRIAGEYSNPSSSAKHLIKPQRNFELPGVNVIRVTHNVVTEWVEPTNIAQGPT